MAGEVPTWPALEHGPDRREQVVKVYVEGGAQDSALDRSLCRRAFSKLFTAAGFGGKLPRTVSCGGRKKAYDALLDPLNNPRPGGMALFLLDSEGGCFKRRNGWG